MKKKVLSMFLVAAMAGTMLAGCGGNGDEGSSGTDGSAEGETKAVTLTVMGPSEDQDSARGAWLQTQCEAFNEAHPEWDITFEYLTCSEADAKDTVLQDPAAAADVYMFANDQISELVKAGAISKLGGSTEEYVKSSNTETMAATVVWEGATYGVPYTSNTWFMYYDKRVFSEEDVKSMEAMLEKGKVSFPLDNGWYLAAFYAANGCTFYGDGTDEAAGIDLGGEKAVQVTEYICNLISNPNFVIDDTNGSVGLAGLKDGSVNAYFNGNWNYNSVAEAIGEENVGVATLPTINVGGSDKQLKAFLGSKAIGVNPNCEDQDVAVALAAWLGGEESQLSHFELRGQAPVNSTVANNATVLADPVASAMADVAVNASICQPLIDMQGYWDAATPFGDAFAQGAEDQTTLDNAAEKTEAFNQQCNGSLVE